MRASTNASWSTSSPIRSRSAATCWPGESWPRWSSWTPCCASFRASSVTITPPWRSHFHRPWRAHRSTRITPGRPSGGAGRFPTFYCRAITLALMSGAERNPSCVEQVRYHDRPPASPIRRGLPYAMSTLIDSLERTQLRRVPRFQPGDRVKVHFQVIEGTRRRTQVFEGVVIKRQGEGVRETFTVRKQSFGVGVERTFPLHSPKIERIE